MKPRLGISGERNWAELDARLGRRIRHRRKAEGLSLGELAAASGISIGLLSQIERGLSSPSLRVLATLADALRIGLGDLFGEDGDGPPPPPEQIVVRASERKQLLFWRTGISKQLLTPSGGDSRLDIFMVVLEPSGTTGSQLYAHDGVEGGLVLEGSIYLTVETSDYRLAAGDSFRFASTREHSFRNAGSVPARVLWVNARAPRPAEA